MSKIKKITVLVTVLALLLCLPAHAHAAEPDSDDLIRQLINYFHYYQEDATTDYSMILSRMEEVDPALSRTWSGILDFWIHLNSDMEVHNEILPDGLPDDDSLCIVVMGYYLKSDGTMRQELYDRLAVALESARKYPNAYILVTGSGSNNTEAGQMSKWLIRQGISEDRIIAEHKATSTIENAKYSCALLYRDYPQVTTLAVITSDYHIFRSCLYFNTQAALDAYDLGIQPMKVVASATCRIKPNAPSDIDTQVEGMGILTDLDVVDLSKPPLSRLEEIRVSGPSECPMGEEPVLSVTAVYTNGFTQDVTWKATCSGIDFGKSGLQTVTVSYREGDTEKTAYYDIEILPPVTALPTEPSTAPTEPETTEPSDESAVDPVGKPQIPTLPLLIGSICIGLLVALLALKARLSKKRRRRPRPEIKLD